MEPSASPSPPATPPVLIWDLPLRLFHWLLAASFAGAYLTAESERWRSVHVTLGYTLAGLIAFRLLWGLVGPRHARFGSFVRGPRAVAGYLKSLLTRRPEHHAGHNPAGALAVVGLLTLGLGVSASGWAVYNDWGPRWLEDLHEGTASAMLGLVAVHVAGVVVASWLHHENLARSMLNGRKQALPSEAIPRPRRAVAAVLLVAVLGFWTAQWAAPGSPDGATKTAGAKAEQRERSRHDKDHRSRRSDDAD